MTPWTVACQASHFSTISLSLLKLMSIELVMLSNHPLLSLSPPAFNLSQHQGLFQWVGSSHQVAEYRSSSFSLSPSSEYSGLISFRIDWFDLAISGCVLYHTDSEMEVRACCVFITDWKRKLGSRIGESIKVSCGANSRLTLADPIGCSELSLTPDLPDLGRSDWTFSPSIN